MSWLPGAVALLVSACERQTLESFSALDRDGDGRLSHQEASADPLLQGTFAQLDVNKDGELSAGEYLSAAQ